MTENELPLFGERLVGASCTLDAPQLRARLGAWRDLRNRARAVESVSDGVRLILPADEPMADMIDLVVSESECCAFYTFTVSVEGPERRLEISAGPGGGPAVQALLGMDG
jgi:MerR family copper efflux transcriptional regulator